MLKANNPDLTPGLDLSKVQAVPGVEFQGSYVRETLYPISGEEFKVAQVDLPPLEITIKGKTQHYQMGSGGIRGNIPKTKYTDYYAYFYEKQQGLIEFENKIGDRNLLIIGSSYSRSLIPFLASHYKHTYNVDLRKYSGFSLSKFVASHSVDDVLIVANDFVLYRDDWLINP